MDHLVLPVNAHPTEVLASRFAAWRKLIRAINVYLRENASVQEEVVRQNVRLSHAMNVPFFDYGSPDIADDKAIVSGVAPVRVKEVQTNAGTYMEPADERMFLPYGNHSVGDIPGTIIHFHRQQATAASKLAKELNQQVIPRLEDLRRDLLVKIREIKNLASDFKNSVSKEQSQTAKDLQFYTNALESLDKSKSPLVNPKHDPYLLKAGLEGQINRQVNEENYLLEAFLNLQGSGRELEYVVVQELQQALDTFAKLYNVQAENIINLLQSPLVTNGFIQKDPAFEWDSFVERDPNFVDPALKPRKASDIRFPGEHNLLAYKIREGYLERRSKYLKSYSKAWYVLTPGFLHEFKSHDRRQDPNPVMSLSLDECQLSADSKSSGHHSHKFILSAKQAHKGHNWVFRTESETSLKEWFSDLQKLTELHSIHDRAKAFAPAADKHKAEHLQPQEHLIPQVAVTPASKETEPGSPASATSEVTSTGEPFSETPAHASADLSRDHEDLVDEQPKARGRFGSEVNLEGGSEHVIMPDSEEEEAPIHRRNRAESAAQFLGANDLKKMTSDDNASVFSYDLKQPNSNTMNDDESFEPVHSDIPVQLERRLTQSKHKDTDDPENGIGVARAPDDQELPTQEALSRRRSSVVSIPRDRPTRRATGSFGTGDDLKPLTAGASSDGKPGLFFANGLPGTTGGRE